MQSLYQIYNLTESDMQVFIGSCNCLIHLLSTQALPPLAQMERHRLCHALPLRPQPTPFLPAHALQHDEQQRSIEL